MKLRIKILIATVIVSLLTLSSGALAAERINIYELKNNIDSLEQFSIEIDSYLASLKSQGYDIAAEEKIWNNIKGLISEAKKEYDAKNYNTAQRLIEQIGPLYDTFRSGLENEDSTTDLKAYVDWIDENQKSIDDYLDNLTSQGHDLNSVRPLWETAKRFYLSGKAEYEKGNYERASELFGKADGVYDEFEWELNAILDSSFDDKAIKDLKDGLNWYVAWSNETEQTLESMEEKGYDVNKEWELFSDIQGLYDDAQRAFEEKHYWRVAEIFEEMDNKIKIFEDTLEKTNENALIAGQEEHLTNIKEFLDEKNQDLKNQEYIQDWEKYGFNISEIEAALKEIEDKYNDARRAFDAKDYDKTADLLNEGESLIESYDYNYYYGWDVTRQISDLQGSLSEANDWISSAKNDTSLAGQLAEIKSLYNQTNSLVIDADKLYSEGKKDETIAKLEEASVKEQQMWSKIEEFDKKAHEVEEAQGENNQTNTTKGGVK